MADWNLCPNCGNSLASASPAQPQSPAQQSVVTVVVTSHTARNAAIALTCLLVIGGVFFLAPFVPYQECNFMFCGSATVSASYAMFHCGMVFNTQIGGYVVSSGARWVC